MSFFKWIIYVVLVILSSISRFHVENKLLFPWYNLPYKWRIQPSTTLLRHQNTASLESFLSFSILFLNKHHDLRNYSSLSTGIILIFYR